MKSRMIQPGSRNVTPTQKYSTDGYKRFKALREFDGRDAHGNLVGREAYVDMHTLRAYPAGPNWQFDPPDLPSGDPGRELRCQPPSRVYRENFGKIDWER